MNIYDLAGNITEGTLEKLLLMVIRMLQGDKTIVLQDLTIQFLPDANPVRQIATISSDSGLHFM